MVGQGWIHAGMASVSVNNTYLFVRVVVEFGCFRVSRVIGRKIDVYVVVRTIVCFAPDVQRVFVYVLPLQAKIFLR